MQLRIHPGNRLESADKIHPRNWLESADKEMSIIHAGNMTKLDQTNTSQIICATFNVAIPGFIFHKFPHPIPFKMYVPQSHQVKE